VLHLFVFISNLLKHGSKILRDLNHLCQFFSKLEGTRTRMNVVEDKVVKMLLIGSQKGEMGRDIQSVHKHALLPKYPITRQITSKRHYL
jgi:hypothetical protein